LYNEFKNSLPLPYHAQNIFTLFGVFGKTSARHALPLWGNPN
jgi:hypothetical protein